MYHRNQKLRAAVVGKDGRTSAIIEKLQDSRRIEGPVGLLSDGKGPNVVAETVAAAERSRPDFVVIGPEEPLAAGVVDALLAIGIPCVGPTQKLAQLESSKAFTRELLRRKGISGNPEFRVFSTMDGIASYLAALGDYVIKPDGLTGGKGVRVSGSHIHNTKEALAYCQELLSSPSSRLLIEERLEGEEFSLQSFSDGRTVKHMMPVQDHKRAFSGDRGPNTGGMGSYTCEDHSLPFLSDADLKRACQINESVISAVREQVGESYKGVLFGGFMATRDGIRLIEYNARFGDPEALNVLSLMETDFGDVCAAIVDGTLHELDIRYRHLASVCKYVVPSGYPTDPVCGELIDLQRVPRSGNKLHRYLAAVEETSDGLKLTGSRAVAFVGLGSSLGEAYAIAEAAASAVEGPVYHREDIGSAELVASRVRHMHDLQQGTAV
jgi:phosphoribosylamine--glycine ligase